MQLYISKGDYVATWHFSHGDQLVPYASDRCYSDFYEDLFKILTILEKHKMLIPKFIGRELMEPLTIISTDISGIIEEIKQYGNGAYFPLFGDTIIFTESGEEIHHSIFTLSIECYRKYIMLSTKSDVWLPMSVDFDTYWFHWNLERYNLNYHRLEAVLNEIRITFNWEEDSHMEIDVNRALKLGYKIFMEENHIKQNYKDDPNPDFNLGAYLAEIALQKTRLNWNQRVGS
jgi:hypothetical protein